MGTRQANRALANGVKPAISPIAPTSSSLCLTPASRCNRGQPLKCLADGVGRLLFNNRITQQCAYELAVLINLANSSKVPVS